MQRKIALIFGGRSLEKEISIITAMQVLANVDKSEFKVEPIYMDDGNFYVGSVDDVKKIRVVQSACTRKGVSHQRGVFQTETKQTRQVLQTRRCVFVLSRR